MTENRRIALIGAGRIARDYIAVIEKSEDFVLSAIADPAIDARNSAAELAGVSAFADVSSMLQHADVDAAIVLSPPSTHADNAIKMLRAGCDVFCEKPIATTMSDAESMIEVAADSGRRLMMASKFRFVDDVAEARRILRDGTLGPIAFYQNAFCAKVEMTERWNSDQTIAGGGVLIDNGTHSVDLARFLIGPIARVSATFGPRVQPIEVEDSALLLFESEQRTIGRIELSWSIDRPSDHFVELHGALGTLQIGWRRSRFRTDGDWIEFGSGYDKQAAFATQLKHFAEVLRGECEPIIGDEDALASVRIVDAAYRAAELGTWESVRPAELTE